MTNSYVRSHDLSIRTLDKPGATELADLALLHPVRNCYVLSRLEQRQLLSWPNPYSDLLVAFQRGVVHSAILTGANITPVNTSVASRELFAAELIKQGRRCSAIIGPRDEVTHLWNLLGPHWGTARDIRERQYVMAIEADSHIIRDDAVRFAYPADLEALFPACVEMFTQEVGTSPLRDGGGSTYRQRISELISNRRSFVKYFGDEVVFKAEVGCVGGGVAQIQGVWINPRYRGLGLAGPALSSVVALTRAHIAPTVSLVVNDFNQPAIRAYHSVGFKRVDTFSTILF